MLLKASRAHRTEASTADTSAALPDGPAAGLARIDVTAVAAVGRDADVRERVVVRRVVDVDAVAEAVVDAGVEARERRAASTPPTRDAERDVRHVVEEAPAVGEARRRPRR